MAVKLNFSIVNGTVEKSAFILLLSWLKEGPMKIWPILCKCNHSPGSLHPALAGSGAHSPLSMQIAVTTPTGISPVSHW